MPATTTLQTHRRLSSVVENAQLFKPLTNSGDVNSVDRKITNGKRQTGSLSFAFTTSQNTNKKLEMIYKVILTGFRDKSINIDLCNTDEQMHSMTVLQLKSKISRKLPAGIDINMMQLLFTNKRLEGDSTLLSSYGIQNQSVIQFVLRPGQKDKTYKVIIKGLRNESTIIDLCKTEEQMASMTVLQLKSKIAEKIPAVMDKMDKMRLIFKDKELDNDLKTLSSYNIKHQSTIHFVIKVSGGY